MQILILFFLLIPLFSLGQHKTSKVVVNSYDTLTRTTGVLIQLDSVNAQVYASSLISQATVVLSNEGKEVFEGEKQFVVVDAKGNYTFSYFIPYRNINLREGQYDRVKLSCSINDTIQLDTFINFSQPRRYAIDIVLKGATVKQKLLPYDQVKNAKDWAPDPYFDFTVNGSQQPIFKNSHEWNSYQISSQKIHFHILQGDTLYWNFYDKDGIQREWLGSYTNFQTTGDFEDKVYEQMFGQIKGLTFDLKQTELLVQPITIYYKGLTTLHNRKGSLWQIKYDFSKAHVGKAVLPTLEAYSKNGQALDLVYYEAVNEKTPSVGTIIALPKEGTLNYFVPFYAWNNQTEILKFKFESPNEEALQAAPYFLQQKIEFESLVKYTDIEVQEDYEYQEVQGVLLTLQYQIAELDIPVGLKVVLGKQVGKSILLNNGGKKYTTIDKYPHKIEKVETKENLQIFIPYSQIPDKDLNVELSLVLDYNLTLMNEVIELGRYAEKDIKLELETARPAFLQDNYGYQFEVKAKIPKFLQERKGKLEISITKNGVLFENYRFSGNLEKVDSNSFDIKEDSILAAIFVPSRLLKPREKIAFSAVVKGESKEVSTTVGENWEAPQELWNKKIAISLQRFLLEKIVRQDTAISWQYIIQTGDEQVFSKKLPIKWNRKNQIEYEAVVYANREDNLGIYIQNNKTKEQHEVWKGDWSKLTTNDYKVELRKQNDIRKLKINFSEKK